MRARTVSSLRRLLAGAASVLVLAAGLTVASDAGSLPTAAADQSPSSCTGSAALINGGLESPTIPAAGFRFLSQQQVPGWSTTDTQGSIEIWSSGFSGVPAAAGRQFAELNAVSASTLYQDIATTPGQTFAWSLKHRGRAGTDTMRVMIGSPRGTLTQNGPTLSDGNTAWGQHRGTYTIPAGQTVTRFAFQAVRSASGNVSVGNFIDDITFGTGPCLVTSKSVTNLTRTGTTAEVGDTLRYTVSTRNDGGNAALRSVATDVLAAGLDYVPGSIRITSGPGGGSLTDASSDDRAEYIAADRTVRVRLGDGATAATGGAIGVGSGSSFAFDVTVGTTAASTTIANEARVAFFDSVASPTLDRTSTSDETRTPVNPAADLAVTKTLETTRLVAGRPATFTVTATNRGPQTATGVRVSDPLPAGLIGVSATSNGATCTVGDTIECAAADLAVGDSVAIEVTGTLDAAIDPGAALMNTATVAGTLTDPTPADNTATASGTVSTEADVSVVKTFAPAAPVAGQDVTYTVTARNSGPSEARDVTISDPLDPTATFVRVSSGQGTCAEVEQTVRCELGTIAPGSTVSAAIVVRLAAGATGAVQNSASVTTSTSDPDPDDDVDSASFRPDAVADLALTKTASSAQVAAGDTIDFTLAVRNLGASDAENVVLDDTMPAGFTATAVDAPPGADCEITGAAVRCSWPTFAVGGPAAVVVHAVVAADAPTGIVTNSAAVVAPADDVDTTNNSDSVDVDVTHSADLRVTKTAPSTGVPGNPFTYTLVVANDGHSVARGASLTDPLPRGFTASALDVDGCDLTAVALTCALGDIAPGASVTVSLDGRWDASSTGVVRNTATVTSATPDPDHADNTSTADVTLEPSADVSVVKTTTTPTVPRGGTASFLMTVRNDGPSTAVGVEVDELAPVGLTVTEATPSAGTWSASTARWEVGTLLPGDTATLAVTASADAEGALVNTAVVRSQTDDPESSNDRSLATVGVSASADLAIVKTTSAGSAPLNGIVTYALTVTNHGPSPAVGVTVSDALPAALLEPTTSTPGCTIVGSELSCVRRTLASGDAFTATVSGTLDPATDATSLANTASVSADTPDPDTGDNSSTVTVPVAGSPRVELVKSVGVPIDDDGDGRIGVGDDVPYTFTLRNTGAATLTEAVITDPLLGGPVVCAAFSAPLAPGAEITCAPVRYRLTQADIDRGTVGNEASVSAQSAQGSATDDAEVAVTVPAVNSLSLTKSAGSVVDANKSGRVDAGDAVDYTFTVTNTGTATVREATISDPMLGGDVPCTPLDDAALAPGASVTCAPVSSALRQDDIDRGMVRNVASVTANAPRGTVTDSASVSTDAERTAGVELTKTASAVSDADGDAAISAGDTLDYSFSVRNTGSTTANAVTVTDPLLGDAGTCALGTLAPGGVGDCGPIRYTLTQADIENGSVANTATATAAGALGQVTDDATATVRIAASSAVALTKTPRDPVDADGDGRIGAGDTVAYSFLVRNTGTTILRDIEIDDPLLGGALDCPALDGLALDPQSEATCGPVKYVLAQRDVDAGGVHNVAGVHARSTAGDAEGSAVADVVVRGTDSLDLLKSAAAVVDANGTGRTDAGDTLAYTFTVTNTGTTGLTRVGVSDARLRGQITCDTTELAPGKSVVCTADPAVLTQAEIDAGEIVNTAVGVGTDARGARVTAESTVRTPIEGQPAIALTKSGGDYVDANVDGRIDVDDTVAFRFRITNTGARTLTGVVIDDPMLGGRVACTIPDLAPGDIAECGPVRHRLSAADVASGEVRNVATVRGSADAGVVTGAATVTVDVTALATTGGVVTGLGWGVALVAVGCLVLLIARVRRRQREG